MTPIKFGVHGFCPLPSAFETSPDWIMDYALASRGEMRAQTRPVSTVLSGQSTPHMIRSRVTHHVIQSATLATFQVRSMCM